ncbi:MAG: DUF5663 domain-containing protein [Patescibacteria group bacterium]|nr:DUF5663 domain-containing protein [Patescibacteria group bacterium]MDD5164563.1 DUF5663 domain-containing protein [Patescibacteria group bacterium]MDD5534312.1 DUF5663 domain-containing protein [Patescibacteria group bacterium]
MPEENPIKNFVDELVRQAEINLPPEEIDLYKDKLIEQVERRLGLTSLNYLDEKGLAEYEKIMDKNPASEELQNFFSSHIENYQEKMTKTLGEFSQEYFASLNRS